MSRLAAIYDAFDKENYQEAIKIASKPGGNDLTQALLAYAHVCVKNSVEGLRIARELISKMPTDETVISTLAHTFKACRADTDLVACYDNAWKVMPSNDKFGSDLFGCHLRLNEPKKMQLISQKLYKQSCRSMYCFWSVVAMMLQNDLPAAMLTVAERTIAKVFSDATGYAGIQPGCDEVELYIHTMVRQGKVQEAITALNLLSHLPRGPVIADGDDFLYAGNKVKMHVLRLRTLLVELLLRLPRSEANISALQATLTDTLALYPDQWEAHKQLIDLVASRRSHAQDQGQSQEEKQLTAGRVVQHQLFIKDMQSKHPKLRGPWLAELYLLSCWLDFDSALPLQWQCCTRQLPPSTSSASGSCSDRECTAVLAELASLLVQFIERFQTKQCCFSDIKPYLSRLGACWCVSAVQAWAVDRQCQLSQLVTALHQRMLSVQAESSSSSTSAASSSVVADKKKKKKNKAGKAVAPAAVENSSSAAELEEIRNESIELICSLCKVRQVSHFCSVLSFSSVNASATVAVSVSAPVMYDGRMFEAARALCNCSPAIGGDREVQPSDELLLLEAAVRKELVHKTRAAMLACSQGCDCASVTATNDSAVSKMAYYLACVRWAELLETGMSVSPHNYIIKLELMEALRCLCVVEPAVVAFSGMRVRYSQLDSLSYVILPSLQEGGLFAEAAKQHRFVCTFHSSVRRETAEAMCNCFKSASYMQALQLRDFIDHCQLSMQHALTKAELPVLELAENLHELSAVRSYLDEYVAGQLTESQTVLSEDQLAALRDNGDYNVVVRFDVLAEREAAEVAVRQEQYKSRIRQGQAVVQLLHYALAGREHVALSSLSTLSSEMAHSQLTSAPEMMWNQAVCGGADSEGADVSDAVMRAVTQLCVRVLSSSSSEEVDCSECVSLLQQVASWLCVDDSDSGSSSALDKRHMPPCSNTAVGSAPLCPMWLQRVSGWCRGVNAWLCVLVLGALARGQQRHKDDESCVTASAQIQAVKGVAVAFVRLLDQIQRVLQTEDHDSQRSADSVQQFLNHWDQHIYTTHTHSQSECSTSEITPTPAHPDSETGAILVPVAVTVAEQIVSSQQLTCSRLRQVIRAKMTALQNALDEL